MDYIFDFSKLRGRIREICGTEENWAKMMGFSNWSKSMKLNNKSYFTSEEIIRCCEILKIKRDEIGIYFFNIKG